MTKRKTVYAFKFASLGDPQEIGEALEKLRQKTGMLEPRQIVEAASKKHSVLHQCFEWDDKIAGLSHRNSQAQSLLRNVVIVRSPDMELEEPVRAFVSIASERHTNKNGSYTSITVAIKTESYCESLMLDALEDLKKYRHKYKMLSTIAGWTGSIDDAVLTLERTIVQNGDEKEVANI